MERVENFVGGASMNIDTTINDILDNKYFFIIIIVLILLYGSLNESRLTTDILRLFDAPLSRVFIIGFIYYVATKNVPLAILMLTATVVTMNTHNKHRSNVILVSMYKNGLISKHSPKTKHVSKKSKNNSLNQALTKLVNGLNQVLERGLAVMPKPLTDLAVKTGKLSKSMGLSTPKVVKQIKNFNTGKSSPKASPKPSNNSPSSSPKSVSSSKSTSSGKSDNLLSNSIISKLLKDRRINASQANKLSQLKSNSVLDLIKPEDVMDLYVNEKISDKLLNKLLEKVTPKTQIIFPKRK